MLTQLVTMTATKKFPSLGVGEVGEEEVEGDSPQHKQAGDQQALLTLVAHHLAAREEIKKFHRHSFGGSRRPWK